MKPLTRRQAQVLAVIQSFIAEHGYAPVTREIGALVGLSSTSMVHWHLDSLERKGYLTREPHKPRTLRVLKTA